MNNLDSLFVESADELRRWLKENHAITNSIWLIKWKKEAGKSFVNYNEIVEQLICFGWIDSLPRKLDQHKTMLLISPRNPKSNWSAVNKKRVSNLLQKGLMQPAGLKLIEQAKENGSWTFLDDVEQLIIPEDLAAALKDNAQAAYYFGRFPASSKRGILEWIKNAKQPATREKRVKETTSKAAQNTKANHPKGRDAGPKDKTE